MPNGTKVVMIRHGEYISVYSNLGEVFIEKGQEVATKENIGACIYFKTGRLNGDRLSALEKFTETQPTIMANEKVNCAPEFLFLYLYL